MSTRIPERVTREQLAALIDEIANAIDMTHLEVSQSTDEAEVRDLAAFDQIVDVMTRAGMVRI